MRLSWVSLALAAVAARSVVAVPASTGSGVTNKHNNVGDISNPDGNGDFYGPDILGGGVNELYDHVSQDIQRAGQNPESYGLGPVPGYWPGHRPHEHEQEHDGGHDREHKHKHKHDHKHEHEDDREHKHKHKHDHEHDGEHKHKHKHDHEHDAEHKHKHDHGHKHEHDHDQGKGHHHGGGDGGGGEGRHSHSIGKCKQRDFTPRVREFDWSITYGPSAPDGFLKKRIFINGQSPGPLIEANEGDTLVIKVKNFIDQGTSIHWHGMYQNSTPFMDGIAGFSQCPIPPGGELVYRFKIMGQWGPYWYHSHSLMQYTDGLYGGLIVHSKNDPYQKCRDYDDERVFLFNDNYHDFANDIVDQLLSAKGYNGTSAAPSPQSGLINGVGQFNCAALAKAKGHQPGMPSKCTQLGTPTMDIEPGKKYRFRFINVGSHAQHIISIDNHEMHVIYADGTPVKPHKVHRIPIHNGQRHEVLVQTNVGKDGDSFLLRSTMMTACFAFVDPLLDPVANLTLQYKAKGSKVKSRAPIPHDWKDKMGTLCQDLKDSDLIPAIDTSVPPNHNLRSLGIFNSQFGNLQLANGTTLGRFFIDNTTFVNYVNKPYLELAHRGIPINSSTIASLLVTDDIWVADIIINNEDTFLDHPFHLHGTDMHIIARGKGNITQTEWIQINKNGVGLNIKNPLRRDTITVERASWIIVRIITDLPGVWPFHCHIAMHLAQGLMAAVAIHPKKLQQLPFSQEVLDLCPTSGPALDIILPA
ncbi:related to FET5 - multicopper oxidase [Ustilago trichophora]|uniref:Related to FET5 - multicopper oxidase n=1 Tax=Ustilago trichophora TaxID=86804 RepID=A0A5C3ENM5_9BASI|nr:related to FET5 - multicopper oxidase [Ustilago trichophora]